MENIEEFYERRCREEFGYLYSSYLLKKDFTIKLMKEWLEINTPKKT
jgi:hypothetical protein